MKTLQEHYNAIKTGQGNKAQFVKQARNLFPEYFNQYTNYDNAVSVLKSKQIISEAAGGVVSKGFDIYDWKKILEAKAVEKEISKEAAEANRNAFQPSDMKNADNVNFNEIMKGFYCEMKDPANKDKTGDELKAMVVKNLAKDPLYYTKDGMFGVKGVGFTDEAPALGKNTQPTSKVASVLGGRDEVDSKSDIVKNSLVGATKKVKLKEGIGMFNDPIGYEKPELSDLDKMFTKKYKGNGVYVIYKNGEEVKTIEGEGNANAWINDEMRKLKEALYQGPSVKVDAGGSLGGKRFIPRFTALSRDAVDAINAKGAKRLNWGKPHIKVVKSGDGVKLLISKLLVDTIVGSERGRSKLSLAVSKMGTGITPEEMSEVTGEFKKLVKVLSAKGKLSQNGDYFLLDVPTKYNEKYNQYEMPLPAEVAESEMSEGEQKLRSLIRDIIKEELDWDRFNIQVSSDNYEGTIKRDSEGWMMYDEDNQPEEAGPFKTLDSLMSYYDLSKDDLIGDYVKNLK